jgi:4-hydroxybutyryl-CoA dehydratase/vinylacetyl-CoA-Delta-isomerase
VCSTRAEWEHSQVLTYSYATHHRHSCIAARAGFGDLLIGAGALMCEANGLDPATKSNLREPMVELIKITEGFFACGVAASVYATRPAQRLLHARAGVQQHRQAAAGHQNLRHAPLAHEVSGGLIVALPGPDEDHNPATAASLVGGAAGQPDVPYDKRIRRRASSKT